jgi:hypothetical protein
VLASSANLDDKSSTEPNRRAEAATNASQAMRWRSDVKRRMINLESWWITTNRGVDGDDGRASAAAHSLGGK